MFEEQILKLKEYALKNFVPIVRDNTIERIKTILKEKKVENILEIGTAIGYSGINMLANSNANLTTIEKDQERFIQAKQNFEEFNLISRVHLIEGDAFEVLTNLTIGGEKFDFIFLDGPKGQYFKYFPLLKQLLNKNGILFADNLLLGGLLKDHSKVTHKNRTMVRNMQQFISLIKTDSQLKTEIFEIDDGFSISEKIY